jgi:hypothetical protein
MGFDGLPMPFMVGSIKVWPCSSKAGFHWFIAYEGKPYYFKGHGEAVRFANAAQSENNDEGGRD